jgi:hypothetical protein
MSRIVQLRFYTMYIFRVVRTQTFNNQLYCRIVFVTSLYLDNHILFDLILCSLLIDTFGADSRIECLISSLMDMISLGYFLRAGYVKFLIMQDRFNSCLGVRFCVIPGINL